MNINKELLTALDKSKIGLMREANSIFICTILFSLRFSWDDRIPTACTNGLKLMVNPDFFAKLTHKERIGLLAHEAWHVAFQHMIRVGIKDFRLWNIATDFNINNMLDLAGYTLPKGGLIDHQYDGLTSEQIYDKIVEDPDNSKYDDFDMDMEFDDSDQDPATSEAIQSAISDIVMKAALTAKMQNQDPGSIPGEIMVALDKLMHPKLPWHTILQRYLTNFAPDDYSYKRFNKRFLPEFYLPTLYSESLGEIAVAVDTSASITDEQFIQFISEIQGIKRALLPSVLTVIDFDTSIKEIHTLNQADDVSKVTFTGRGGTDIKEVLEWGLENKPEALVIFTDGYFHLYDIDPEIPVIWIIHSNGFDSFNSPFGKIIEYKD